MWEHTSIAPSRRYRALLTVILGMLTAFGSLSIDMYLPGLPAIARELHADAAAAQRTLAVFFLGMALGQVLYGPISDRLGRRGPLVVGCALYALTCIGCALAPSIRVLMGFRFAQAVGACAGSVIARSVVRDLRPGAAQRHRPGHGTAWPAGGRGLRTPRRVPIRPGGGRRSARRPLAQRHRAAHGGGDRRVRHGRVPHPPRDGAVAAPRRGGAVGRPLDPDPKTNQPPRRHLGPPRPTEAGSRAEAQGPLLVRWRSGVQSCSGPY